MRFGTGPYVAMEVSHRKSSNLNFSPPLESTCLTHDSSNIRSSSQPPTARFRRLTASSVHSPISVNRRSPLVSMDVCPTPFKPLFYDHSTFWGCQAGKEENGRQTLSILCEKKGHHTTTQKYYLSTPLDFVTSAVDRRPAEGVSFNTTKRYNKRR